MDGCITSIVLLKVLRIDISTANYCVLIDCDLLLAAFARKKVLSVSKPDYLSVHEEAFFIAIHRRWSL